MSSPFSSVSPCGRARSPAGPCTTASPHPCSWPRRSARVRAPRARASCFLVRPTLATPARWLTASRRPPPRSPRCSLLAAPPLLVPMLPARPPLCLAACLAQPRRLESSRPRPPLALARADASPGRPTPRSGHCRRRRALRRPPSPAGRSALSGGLAPVARIPLARSGCARSPHPLWPPCL